MTPAVRHDNPRPMIKYHYNLIEDIKAHIYLCPIKISDLERTVRHEITHIIYNKDVQGMTHEQKEAYIESKEKSWWSFYKNNVEAQAPLAPPPLLIYYKTMISWPKRREDKHRDSLFNLPLYPPPPQGNDGVDIASQQLTADVNQRLVSFSVAKARRQLTETIFVNRLWQIIFVKFLT